MRQVMYFSGNFFVSVIVSKSDFCATTTATLKINSAKNVLKDFFIIGFSILPPLPQSA